MTYRILSLDGGGSWAMLQAMALRRIYGDAATGHDVLRDFDMAAANSGGAIVLAALMADFPLSRIVDLFGTEAQVQTIFVTMNLFEKALNPIAKYRTEAKRDGLQALLGAAGDRTLEQWPQHLPNGPHNTPVNVMITAFDYDTQRAEFFRTFPTGLGTAPSTIPLTDAVHASSNAPVAYFNKPTIYQDRRYWDGGVAGLNNPMMVALTEALTLRVPAQDIRIRSIGTGAVRLAPPGAGAPVLCETRESPGWLHDLMKLAGSVLDDPPDQASNMAYIALARPVPPAPTAQAPIDSGAIVRLNAMVQPLHTANGWIAPPGFDLTTFPVIAGLGMDARVQRDLDGVKALGDAWIDQGGPNQTIRSTPDTYDCLIGDATFAAGSTRWRQW